MEYKVIASNIDNFVMATGFYGETGKEKAQKRIDEGYFNQHLLPELKHAEFIVVECNPVPNN